MLHPEHLVARARLELLFDPGTFRPTRSLVGDGVLSGSGRVNGRVVCAWAQDGAFKGGSLGTRGGETIARTIEHADKIGSPVVGFPHSGGARLQEGVGGAARLQRDLPRAGAGHGAADQRDRRPVRRRRGVLARARRPHGHGRARREDVPHRPGRGRARHAREGHGARARRAEDPRAQRRRAPLRRARRARGRAGALGARPPALQGGRRSAALPAGRTGCRATPARCSPRASARSTTCARSPRD